MDAYASLPGMGIRRGKLWRSANNIAQQKLHWIQIFNAPNWWAVSRVQN